MAAFSIKKIYTHPTGIGLNKQIIPSQIADSKCESFPSHINLKHKMTI